MSDVMFSSSFPLPFLPACDFVALSVAFCFVVGWKEWECKECEHGIGESRGI
jgi:hypothetical protein